MIWFVSSIAVVAIGALIFSGIWSYEKQMGLHRENKKKNKKREENAPS